MTDMFVCNTSLEYLDLSNFNTANVTNMFHMFARCEKLKVLNLSNFDTSNVANMTFMFGGCSLLNTLYFNKAIFEKTTDYVDMFQDVFSSINIITKDLSTKSWLEARLNGVGTVTIAS